MEKESKFKKIPQVKIASAVGGMLSGHGSKISNATFGLMIATALFYDLLSIVPVVNWFVAIFAWLTFALWFMILGVGLISPKKVATWGSSAVIGVIPVLAAIPELTLAVIITVILIRAEDELGIKIPTPGANNPLKGGRGRLAKTGRRMSQTPEHGRQSLARLDRINRLRKNQESKSVGFDGIKAKKTA